MSLFHRLLVAALTGCSGAAVMIAMLGFRLANPEFVWAAAGGATVAGALCAGFFDRALGWGMLMAALGAVLATFLGAALAGFGLVVLARAGGAVILFAPLMVSAAILSSPTVFLIWAGTMSMAHLVPRLLGRIAPRAA